MKIIAMVVLGFVFVWLMGFFAGFETCRWLDKDIRHPPPRSI